MMSENPPRVSRLVIVDDQSLLRTGLRLILEQHGFEVVGEAGDGRDGVALVRELAPDVVLMDVRMPDMDGIEATRRIVQDSTLDTRVLMLTTFDADEHVYAAMAVGASGFLLKDAPSDDLVHAIRVIARGDALLAPTITRRLIERFVSAATPSSDPPGFDELTDREHEVFAHVAQGLSNAEIARALFLAEPTVKTHVTRILTKLRMRDRVQLVVLAYESGVVRPRPR